MTPEIKDLYQRNGLRLVCTCGACPEQYDVYRDDYKVAYYRLRHGLFRVDVMGETIYEAYTHGDGMFSDDERLFYMAEAMEKVLSKIKDSTLKQ